MATRKETVRHYPGNTIMSQKAFDEHVYKVGKGWLETVRQIHRWSKEGLIVGRISIKGGLHDDSGTLIVVTASNEAEGLVAFHNGDDLATMWTGFSNRAKNGKLGWKKDEYA